ncbi:peptide-N-glycosidase F-related protein [Cyclobacterium sp. 1_MG-2023]|uniref:peptide-N-glycosidase F-related protein n=1 Tax=Cyclobacterium sp. 1_MG-2023 TaxID=3062681 RepID=UPI0026E469FC|nr:peptide-N-glycosidase F-related protein [Cyclobacterium sp. 1_MG-2023]MDO6440004.1 peptide-N-glycosidase F-related protein [Cyclobacterium sp. 1_MG-2023]
MKQIVLTALLPLLLIVNVWAEQGDTLQIISHDAITVVTNPSKGANTYSEWAVFPDIEVPIRKIVMKIKFACPDNMRCADWDYLDHITIKRTGGKEGELQDFEIGRMLTPYGGAFGEKWEFDWQVDVTDFSLLLRDSVELEYKHTGYEPNNDRGWKVTVAFDLIKGQPAMEPISITKIYDGSFAYGDKEKPIEKALKPVQFSSDKGAAMGRLRILQTGHGMDRPDGCGEFCNKYRDFLLDEKLVASRQIWKQCGDNPLYPQAGTWIFDRANWCPGDLIQPDLYDFELSKSAHTVQLKMENYNSPKPSANELIAAYLIQYKAYRKKNDVAIEDIIIPSNKAIHNRLNPAAFGPSIVIKNNGAEPLTKLSINHGSKGGESNIFNWEGLLQPGEMDTVTMPGLIPQKGALTYQFELRKPNGRKDASKQDNLMSTNYTPTPVHEPTLIFHLETNKKPEDNAYQVMDAKGNVLYQREVGTLVADTLYKDSLQLSKGAYQLVLKDEGGDGLEFWYKTKAGRGKAILLNSQGKIVKSFNSDFGSSITYNFTVGDTPDSIMENEISLGVFPTRTKDFTYFDFLSNNPEEVLIKLIRDPGGEVVEEHLYRDFKEGRLTFDLSRYPKSRYFFRVFVNDKVVYNKRLRVKE